MEMMKLSLEKLFLRKAVPADTDCVMGMIADAKEQMRREGKQQWQGAYPALSDISADIAAGHGYVLCSEYTPVAYGAVLFGPDPSYAVIQGAWLNEHPYAVIHRLAVSSAFKRQGVAACFFERVEERALQHGVTDIRVDTNFDNEYMQRLLARRGYVYCGGIQNPNGSRLAFQKELPLPAGAACWFLFQEGSVLLEKTADGQYRIPCAPLPPVRLSDEWDVHALPALGELPCYAGQLTADVELGDSFELCALRTSFDRLSLAEYRKAGFAFQQLFWDNNSRFCPVCGCRMQHQERIMKKCPCCGKEVYPPIMTAIMVLVRKDDKILLVRSKSFRGNYYGLVAGFLEPGETLEECVAREVREETGLTVGNVTYLRSQSWPYPSGLMVGFAADCTGGELKLQEDELCAGGFFGKDELPDIPGKVSLARQLIDLWLSGELR